MLFESALFIRDAGKEGLFKGFIGDHWNPLLIFYERGAAFFMLILGNAKLEIPSMVRIWVRIRPRRIRAPHRGSK